MLRVPSTWRPWIKPWYPGEQLANGCSSPHMYGKLCKILRKQCWSTVLVSSWLLSLSLLLVMYSNGMYNVYLFDLICIHVSRVPALHPWLCSTPAPTTRPPLRHPSSQWCSPQPPRHGRPPRLTAKRTSWLQQRLVTMMATCWDYNVR